jgi:hypothetical protein
MNKLFLITLVGCLISAEASAEFIGIPQDEFQPHYTPQLESNWCWASSAAMVMSYQGVNIPQNEIVSFIKSANVNQTAQPNEIIRAVNAVFSKDIDGIPSRIVMSGQYVAGAPLPVILYNQLKENKPVIMTYIGAGFGHAVVVTGIDATFGANNLLSVNKVYVFDPYAYKQTIYGLVYDKSRIYHQYNLTTFLDSFGYSHITIPPGEISGMILMNSSVVPVK